MVLLAGEFLRVAKPFIEDGVHPQILTRAYTKATNLALKRIEEIAVKVGTFIQMLVYLATKMSG